MPDSAKPSSRASDVRALNRIAEQLGSVRREGLTEKLVERLSSLVLRGVLSPGDRLPPERELSEMLRVSRSSLRQALKAMQVMGVLEVRQGSGNYLSENAREILSVPAQVLAPLKGFSQAELFEVRRALEAEATATAAARATKIELEKIRAECESGAASAGEAAVFRKHDLAFHQAIAGASGNRFFEWFLALANRVLFRELRRRPAGDIHDLVLREHRRILAAIEAGDPEAARREMLLHLSYSRYRQLDEKQVPGIRFLAYEAVPKTAASDAPQR